MNYDYKVNIGPDWNFILDNKNNDLGCSQEARGLRAGAQPVHAISLLLAKLVRHSAPYPFVSWKYEGLTPQRSTIDN